MFAAYRSRCDGTDFSFDNRDESKGILGTYHPRDDKPVATAASLQELELKSNAFLGTDPEHSLYLTDDSHRVYQILICSKHHQVVDTLQSRLCVAIALLLFCVICLLAATVGNAGSWALAAFAGVAVLYFVIMRFTQLNEIEAAFICIVLLIVFMLNIYARGLRSALAWL